jgi:transposase-like protein
MNLIDAFKTFPDDLACVKYLEKMRWPNGVKCLACESDQVTFYTKKEGTRTRVNRKGETVQVPVPARYLYQCKACRYQFTPTVGTLFNDTHLPLRTWFLAVALMVDAKKGMSALQMQRHLEIGSYKTAWYLCHRIREAMKEGIEGMFGGAVEVDCTFVGGKPDRRRKRAPWQDKPAVAGIVQRGADGKPSQVRVFHVSGERKNVMFPVIEKNIATDAQIYTDESRVYVSLGQTRAHEIVAHSRGEYVRGSVHTNSVENFWSLFKRGVIGSYHQVSIKHLMRYLHEFSYRFNNREAEDLFVLVVMRLLIASALPYQELIAHPARKRDAGPAAPMDKEPF